MKNSALFLLAVLLTACSGAPVRMESILKKTVFIEPFANSTVQPALETEFQEKLTSELSANGGYEIVDRASADVILGGEIKGFSMNPVIYNANNEVEEYETGISALLKVSSQGKPDNNFELTAQSRYFTSVRIDGVFDPVREQDYKAQSVLEAVDYLTREAVLRLDELSSKSN